MTPIEALAEYMTAQGVATFGQDMFISRAPASNTFLSESNTKVPESIWWLTGAGGTEAGRFDLFNIDVRYRNSDPAEVYTKLQDLHYRLTRSGLVELQDNDVIKIEAVPVSDEDIDEEGRMVGLLQLTITTYRRKNNA